MSVVRDDEAYWTGQRSVPMTSSNSFPGGARSQPHIIPPDEDGRAEQGQQKMVDSTPPLSSIEQKLSGVSSTSSSLSDGVDNGTGGGGGASINIDNTNSGTGGCGSTAIEESSRPATRAADKLQEAKKSAAAAKPIRSIMKKRPASDGSKGSLGGTSSASSSNSRHSSRTSSIGWGWFDHNSSLVDMKDAADGKSRDSKTNSGKSKKKKKKGGLLQGFSSAILGESIAMPLEQGKFSSNVVLLVLLGLGFHEKHSVISNFRRTKRDEKQIHTEENHRKIIYSPQSSLE